MRRGTARNGMHLRKVVHRSRDLVGVAPLVILRPRVWAGPRALLLRLGAGLQFASGAPHRIWGIVEPDALLLAHGGGGCAVGLVCTRKSTTLRPRLRRRRCIGFWRVRG